MSTTMTQTVVLVHGAFADHRAFDGVIPLLSARGFKVLAPDLAAHGDDPTPIAQVSLDTYVHAIAEIVRIEGEVILVGHSMAGMVVSQVAELCPDRVKALIYVAAYLPQSGDTLQSLAGRDGDSLVGKNLEFAPDYSTVRIRTGAVVEAVCADVPPEVQQIIVDGQKPEPLKPFQGTVTLTPENFGRVPKAYIRTTRDRAVTPQLQDSMLEGHAGIPIETVDTSHLPFVAAPEAFVRALVSAIGNAR